MRVIMVIDGFIKALPVADLPEGQARKAMAGDLEIALIHHEGRIHAISNTCPHMDASLAEGMVKDGIVTCPWHGWRFSLITGRNPFATHVRVATFEVRIADDHIWIHPDRAAPLPEGFIDTDTPDDPPPR